MMMHNTTCAKTFPGPLHVPDIYISVFMFSGVFCISIIHGLQFPARREGPHRDFHRPLSLVPKFEERASPGAVDDETCTAGTELPL